MARKPQIILSSLDVDRIEALLAAMPTSVFPGKAELQAELDRADVVAPEEIPANVVTMNSTVQFAIATESVDKGDVPESLGWLGTGWVMGGALASAVAERARSCRPPNRSTCA